PERRSSDGAPGLIYIAVDETNYLLGESKSGESKSDEDEYLGFLRQTMRSLASILLHRNGVFVFSVTAGITIAPLETAFFQSGAFYNFFRMKLLDWGALMCIMDNLEQDQEQGGSCWQGWHLDTKFVKLLVDYAPMPGVAVVLLK